MKGNKSNERSFGGGKLVGKLLFIVTVANLQQLDQNGKPMIYTGVFVEIYNWHSRRLVHKTHGMVKLEKYPISRIRNLLNLGGLRFYKISQVLQIAHVVPKNTEGKTFYLTNYIDWDQFNQRSNPKWQIKANRSANAIVRKLMPTSKKIMEQNQKAGARAAPMKAPRKMDSGLSNQHKYDDYNIDES